MEIRARYILVGLFVLAVAAAVVGFVYWLSNAIGPGERTLYQVRFDGPVSGLSHGSEVLFNGIEVGEVTELGLIADSPTAVRATIAVARATPVRTDTHVGLDFRGLTGTATVALVGVTDDAPVLAAGGLLVADRAALSDMTQSARHVLGRLDAILAENADAFGQTIADFGTFSAALARNADRLDGLIAALERFAGGGTETPTVNFDLAAPTEFPVIGRLPVGQLVVAEPTTVVAYDTQRIILERDGGDVAVFPETRWADSLPLLFQARFVHAFENAGFERVGSDRSAVVGAFQLLTDLRRFRIATTGEPRAEVAFSAKLVDDTGDVVAARLFDLDAPAPSIEEAAAAASALEGVFVQAAGELVAWTLAEMTAAEAVGPKPGP